MNEPLTEKRVLKRVDMLVDGMRLANQQYEKAVGIAEIQVSSYVLALAARDFLRKYDELEAIRSGNSVTAQKDAPEPEKEKS